jgi:uncharacterized protein
MPFGLSDIYFSQILSTFTMNQHVERAILFGSRAKGTYRPGSDVDIALEGPDLNLKDILLLQNQLDDFDQPYLFDLILFHTITEPALISHIEKTGIEIFRREDQPLI